MQKRNDKERKKSRTYMRQYVKDRREWQARVALGTTTCRTLQAYRDAKYKSGHKAQVQNAVATLQTKGPKFSDLIAELQKTLEELKANEERRLTLVAKFRSLEVG